MWSVGIRIHTLLPIIQQRILPGTRIISDFWKAYDCLNDEGYQHAKVNHSLTFCNPGTDEHKNSIEGRAVLIDLRNETSVAGRIDNADGFMNIDLVEAVLIDRHNQQHPFDHIYIRERLIRQIHIPNSIDIESELNKEMFRKSTKSNTKRTFKKKRAEERHKEILKEIEKSK